jgi:hypothetical protein
MVFNPMAAPPDGTRERPITGKLSAMAEQSRAA